MKGKDDECLPACDHMCSNKAHLWAEAAYGEAHGPRKPKVWRQGRGGLGVCTHVCVRLGLMTVMLQSMYCSMQTRQQTMTCRPTVACPLLPHIPNCCAAVWDVRQQELGKQAGALHAIGGHAWGPSQLGSSTQHRWAVEQHKGVHPGSRTKGSPASLSTLPRAEMSRFWGLRSRWMILHGR